MKNPSDLQSIIRVVFHDRRLQYTEHQQLEGWRWNRPGDRILDLGEHCAKVLGTYVQLFFFTTFFFWSINIKYREPENQEYSTAKVVYCDVCIKHLGRGQRPEPRTLSI